ncbi:MAG: hypothetical protein H8D67_31660 [Deltaproteobacteria bacterium]|nr:hypothetical protein [Deltaproteobacteria bacterium]MBL7176087.1 hypothetical protein [Desulfobacteraceae bacterium]
MAYELFEPKAPLHHLDPAPNPSQDAVVRIIHQVRRILFPGYFTETRLNPVNLEYYLGQVNNRRERLDH